MYKLFTNILSNFPLPTSLHKCVSLFHSYLAATLPIVLQTDNMVTTKNMILTSVCHFYCLKDDSYLLNLYFIYILSFQAKTNTTNKC